MTHSTTSLSRYVAANNILLEEKPFERELFMESFLVENPNILSTATWKSLISMSKFR